MKHIPPVVFLVFCCLCLYSCKCKQQFFATEPVVLNDSVRESVKYIETVRIDTVTVEIEIPAQTSQQIVRDSVSELETDFAWSRAWLNTDGTLGHFLANKPQKIKKDAEVVGKDTETTSEKEVVREVPVPYPVTQYVEKELSTWQKIRLGAFWYLVGAVVILFSWIFRSKLFRLKI